MSFKYSNYFIRYFGDRIKESIEQQNILCPWHDDKENSLGINQEKGVYNCFGCGEKGDIFKLVMKFEHLPFIEAKRKILGDGRVAILSVAEVEECHKYLIEHKHLQTLLMQHRGWLLRTIIKFQLGWDERNKRVTIPIFDENKQLKNIRKYLVAGHVTAQHPKFLGIRGHNESYFFPIENLVTKDEKLSKFILLCAGEPDTILACQCGFNAGTFTSGEGAFNRDLLPLFKDKTVYMCYDKDLAGIKALKAVGPELARFAKEVKIIDLPFGG